MSDQPYEQQPEPPAPTDSAAAFEPGATPEPAPTGEPAPPPVLAVPPAPPVPPTSWPAAPPPPPGTPIPPYTPAAMPPAAYAPATKTSSNAIIALILAVVSWAVCPLIPAIVALVFASMASKEIAASNGRIEGQGLTTAAKIVAWVNIGLYAAIIVVGGFLFVLFAIASSTS